MAPVLDELLVCPRCRGKLASEQKGLRCTGPGCEFMATVADGIVDTVGQPGSSFFDSKVPVMVRGVDEPGSHALFYDQQSRVAEEEIQRAKVILDVGCGPRLMYKRAAGAHVIGVDLSYESLRHNADIDVRVFGSAACLPLPDDSVDAMVGFYVLHHIVGPTRSASRQLLKTALCEFGRVIRPGGSLVVFDVSPWWVAWTLQAVIWNFAKRMLGSSLDMFFWRRPALLALALDCLPQGTVVRWRNFRVAAGTMFPPAFAVPWLRIPRFLYPFDICMYQWRLPDTKPTRR